MVHAILQHDGTPISYVGKFPFDIKRPFLLISESLQASASYGYGVGVCWRCTNLQDGQSSSCKSGGLTPAVANMPLIHIKGISQGNGAWWI